MAAAPPEARNPVAKAAAFVDELLFSVERLMIAVFLIAASVTVAVDFAYQLLRRRYDVELFGIDVTPGLPVIATVATFIVLWAAVATGERGREKPYFGKKRVGALIVAAIATVVVAICGVLLLHVPSWAFYLGAYSAAMAALLFSAHRAGGITRGHVISVALVTPPFVYFALNHMPQEYSWSKELSLVLVLWIGFFGASVCAKGGAHLRIEALEKLAPGPAKKFVRAAGHLAAAAFCFFMAKLGADWFVWSATIVNESPSVEPTSVAAWIGAISRLEDVEWLGGELSQTQIPDFMVTIAVPIAFVLAGVRFIAAAISSVLGAKYGEPTNLEAGAMAEGMADDKPKQAPSPLRRAIFPALIVAVVVLPFLGKVGILIAVILALALIGAPIFALMGAVVIACFVLWGGFTEVDQFRVLISRIRDLGDNEPLLTVPFFVMSGAIMGRGAISRRLMEFSMAAVGWMPGGLGIAAVVACAIFAAISGSSPATVVAVGSIMAPAMIARGYKEPFSHGIVTSAGSLGILIPPSIPMVIFAIVMNAWIASRPSVAGAAPIEPIEVKALFAAGYGPGLVIGVVLAALALLHGSRHKLETQPFSAKALGISVREGAWALAFPVLMALGVAFLTEVQLACFSVVYAVFVETIAHRALKLSDIPKVLAETSVLLGAFLVILIVAMAFGEFLGAPGGPADHARDWVESMHLTPWQFLIVVNVLLLVIGCLLDIMSAIFIFVPLLAPMAIAAGVSPVHFGIIFIVNMEIGYLTPPVGLNLFVSSTVFKKPVDYMIKAVMPFVAVMLIGLTIITFDGGWTSERFSSLLLDDDEPVVADSEVPVPAEGETPEAGPAEPLPTAEPGFVMPSFEEMEEEMDTLEEPPPPEQPDP
jgi:tripartite ATP-independent transporter DctM subunit